MLEIYLKEKAAKQLSDIGLHVVFYQLDVSNQSRINGVSEQLTQRFTRLDVLVNNAAILYDTWQNAIMQTWRLSIKQ